MAEELSLTSEEKAAHDAFHIAYARALLAWASVEFRMQVIYGSALMLPHAGVQRQRAASAYYSSNNWAARLEMVKRAMETVPLLDQHRIEWAKLADRAHQGSKVRNKLAHFIPGYEPFSQPERRHFLIDNVNDERVRRDGMERVARLYTSDIQPLEGRFKQLAEDLMMFEATGMQSLPWPGEKVATHDVLRAALGQAED